MTRIPNVGIYNLHMQAMGGGEKLTLALAEHLSAKHRVTLFCTEPLDIAALESFFGVDLRRVTVTPLKNPGPLSRGVNRMRGRQAEALALHHYRQLRQLNLDLFINNSYGSGLPCPAARGIFLCMFPHATRATGASLDSYVRVVAISEFSAEWVRQRWKRHAEIVYPPCDDMGPPATKDKVVLHVGRFIADSDEDERHHKGQGVLLHAFKQLTNLHREGWELHLAGSAGSDERSRKFAYRLRQDATGFPVFFHFDSLRFEMRDLYRHAAIYWHATGYGFDPATYPSKQEHFGITTVEAMSAGAVPVVYSTGGQKEIVTDGVDGFWWKEMDELLNHTRRLANNTELRCSLGQNAIVSSKRFGKEPFAERIDQLITQVLTK